MTYKNLTSVRGRELGLTPQVGENRTFVAKGGFASGGFDDAPTIVLPGAHDTVAVWEDWLNDTGDGSSFDVKGVDTGWASSHLGDVNGILEIAPANANAAPGGVVTIHMPQRSWRWKQGRLHFGCRIAWPQTSDISCFMGFTDTGEVAEAPIYEDTGAAAQAATATDAVGWLFDRGNSHTVPQMVAVNGGTLKTPIDDTGGGAPTAGKWEVFEMFAENKNGDTGGGMVFLRNGKPVGRLEFPVAQATKLTPIISLFSHDDTGENEKYAQNDWINVSAGRDTGGTSAGVAP